MLTLFSHYFTISNHGYLMLRFPSLKGSNFWGCDPWEPVGRWPWVHQNWPRFMMDMMGKSTKRHWNNHGFWFLKSAHGARSTPMPWDLLSRTMTLKTRCVISKTGGFRFWALACGCHQSDLPTSAGTQSVVGPVSCNASSSRYWTSWAVSWVPAPPWRRWDAIHSWERGDDLW